MGSAAETLPATGEKCEKSGHYQPSNPKAMKSIPIADSLSRNSRKTMFRHYTQIGWLLVLLTGGQRIAAAQAVHPVTGRHIAPVMGVNGADWLERRNANGKSSRKKPSFLSILNPA